LFQTAKPQPALKKALAKPPRATLPPLPKRSPYENMTLIEALKDCLDKNGAPMPDRDLACAVFAVDPAGGDFERAKVCEQ